MQEDELLAEWRRSQLICEDLVAMVRDLHLLGKQTPHKHTRADFFRVYNTVYYICVNDHSSRIDLAIKGFAEIIQKAVESYSINLPTLKGLPKLQEVCRVWQAFKEVLQKVLRMFSFLNRPFYIKEGKTTDLQAAGAEIFCSIVFTQKEQAEYFRTYFNELSEMRKNKNTQNAAKLKLFYECISQVHQSLCRSHKKVESLFERLQTVSGTKAREYFQSRFQQLRKMSPSLYFEQVNIIFQFQINLSHLCFDEANMKHHKEGFRQELILGYIRRLEESEHSLKSLFATREAKPLCHLVQLFKGVEIDFKQLQKPFQDYVYEQISRIIQENFFKLQSGRNLENYCQFVENLLVWNRSFIDSACRPLAPLGDFLKIFSSAARRTLSSVMLPTRMEQLLAVYADEKLKHCQSNKPQLDEILLKLLEVFQLLTDNDEFITRYMKKLCDRVRSFTKEIVQQHEIFVTSLRENFNIKRTEVLDKLIYEIKKGLHTDSQLQALNFPMPPPVPMTLRIFSEDCWPRKSIFEIPMQYLPEQIQRSIPAIKAYEQANMSGKHIRLSFSESTVIVGYKFPGGEALLQMSCLQAVLLNFIHKVSPKKVPALQIVSAFSCIDENLLLYNLREITDSLNPAIIRLKEPDGLVSYMFNNQLQPTSTSIIYNHKGCIVGDEDTAKRAMQNREIIIDAFLVRLMKRKKKMSIAELEAEALRNNKIFEPAPTEIRKSIQRLVEKVTLDRTPDRSMVFYCP